MESPKYKSQYNWKRNHPEKVKEYAKKYRERNRIKNKEYQKRWQKLNKEKVKKWKENWRRRHGIKKFQPSKKGLLKKLLRKHIFERDNYQCFNCKKTNQLLIHHLDGNKLNNSPENLITLCKICHGKITIMIAFWNKSNDYLKELVKKQIKP